MRVLWITSYPIGRAAQLIENRKTQSGTWIDAMSFHVMKTGKIQLHIACSANCSTEIKDENTGIIYHGLSEYTSEIGICPSKDDRDIWKALVKKINPNVIMVWGTEYSTGLALSDCDNTIPVLYYIQGIIGQICKYKNGLLSPQSTLRDIGIISYLKFLHFRRNNRKFVRQIEIEKEMIKKSQGIVIDNDWADYYFRSIYNEVKSYRIPLPINHMFLEERNRSQALIKRYSIFTIDGCNPSKGIFHIINALRIVKEQYPEVHLYIPGRIATGSPKLLRESPYYAYLKKLISRYGLDGNVSFLGQLTQEEMIEHMQMCELFVMPSAIENHSAALREAMLLQMPCIAAQVGSVNEFAHYGVNALTYRYEDEEALAGCIKKLFADQILRLELGEEARRTILQKYPQDDIGTKMIKAYEDTILRMTI